MKYLGLKVRENMYKIGLNIFEITIDDINLKRQINGHIYFVYVLEESILLLSC